MNTATAALIASMNNAADDTLWNTIRSNDLYDDAATAEADPSYRNDVVVLTTGERIEYTNGEWALA